jgi:AhpC/TSA family
MANANTTDRQLIVRVILVIIVLSLLALLVPLTLFALGILGWLLHHALLVLLVVVFLLLAFVPVAWYVYYRLSPFLDVYTEDRLQPLLEARVDTDHGESTLQELTADKDKTYILYFYPQEGTGYGEEVNTLSEHLKKYEAQEGVEVYAISVPPMPSEPSSAAQEEQPQRGNAHRAARVREKLKKQQPDLDVLIDDKHEAVNALNMLNDQVNGPNLALLYDPKTSSAKVYPGVASSTQANTILEDAELVLQEENAVSNSDEERNEVSQTNAGTTQPSPVGQQSGLPEEVQPSPPEEKTRPYNLWFAWTIIGVAVVAYILTLLLFRNLFEDSAIVTGALGALLTLLGTVAGAYFGVKSTSDAADRAKRQVEEANARTERANRSAKAALLEVDPTNKGKEFRDRALL